jgi:orotate phosphoribosyltransferase-like protein
MSAEIMIPLYAATPTLCTMVITYASVIKDNPLPDPSPFHVVWYQTVHGSDRIGVVSPNCADGVAMIQDVCDSVTLAMSIKGCPELSAMMTDSLSKEFTRLVYLLAPYGIKLF